MPLYLQTRFAANYRVATAVPTVFAAGKWMAMRTMTDTGHIAGPVVPGALADGLDLPAAFLFAAVLIACAAWQSPRTRRAAGDRA